MKKRFNIFLILLCSLSSIQASAQFKPKVDLLYWHASQETSSFWASIVTVPNANEIIYTPPNNQFNGDTGVRIGIEYQPVNPFWNTSLVWTHFSTAKNNNLRLAAQIIAPEFFSGFLSRDLFFGADVDWQLSLHTLDLIASHAIPLGQTFILTPSIGIKAASIHQDIHATWDALVYTSQENLKHHYHGIGPSFGLASQWNLSSHFSLVGDFAAAFMWGKWQIQDTYARPSALFGIVTPTTITTSLSEAELGSLMFDYFLGLAWHVQSPFKATLEVGFETQFWANQLRLTTFQILPLHGDLTLQGATCRFQIEL